MKLSIITINYNNAEGLKQTLDSVASQTCIGFEHVVVDGASTDGSVELIREYEEAIKAKGDRLKVKWVSEKDKGIYNAMNKGIRMAEGDYLLFLNSGDYLISPDVLSRALELVHSEDIVGFRVQSEDEDGRFILPSDRYHGFRSLFFDTILHSGSAFIRRGLFEEYGLYDESLKIVADWKFFFDAVAMGKATFRPEQMVLSYYDSTGISNSRYEESQRERKQVLLRYLPDYVVEDYFSFRDDIKSRDEIIYQLQNNPPLVKQPYKKLLLALWQKVQLKVCKK